MGGQFFAAYIPSAYVATNSSAHQTLRAIDTIKEDIWKKNSAQFNWADSTAAILANKKVGKMSALIGIEGGHAIEDDLRLLRRFYELGARYMTLTWSNTNNWCDSSGDINNPKVKHWGGLNELGKSIVLEMNRLGMMVDISHVSDAAFWAALETSKAPIIASHSSCRALSNAPRNMTDDMIKGLAKKDGVIAINFSCARSDALAEEGRSLVTGALGLALVLFVSGLLEAFVTPSGLPTFLRIGIGAVAELAFLAWVVVLGGRAARAGVTGDLAHDLRGDVLPTA